MTGPFWNFTSSRTMDESTGTGLAGSADRTEWEGYSDYKSVSKSIVTAIQNAVTAYAELDSRHSEGAKVHPDMAARGRMHIKAAALQLVPELKRNAGTKEEYREILVRWLGPDAVPRAEDVDETTAASDGGEVDLVPQNPGDGGVSSAEGTSGRGRQYERPYPGRRRRGESDEGYLGQLNEIKLHQECPDWLEDLVLDIKAAGFELGYLQAGRSVSVREPGSPVEEDTDAMFEGLDIT